MAQGFSLEEALGKGTQATGGFSLEEALGRKPEDSGFLRQAADIPLSVGRGALSGVRMVADAFGAGSGFSEAIKGAEGYLADLMSAQAKNDQKEISRIMKDAEDKGMLEQVKAGVKAFTVAPADLLAQGLGSAAPAIAGMLGGNVLGVGAVGARVLGAGIGAAMGAGTTKGSIYEETKKALVDAGLDEKQAEERAQAAQSYGGKNLDQILLGTGLGAFASATGVENAVKNILTRSAAKEAAKTVAKEIPEEVAKKGFLQAAKARAGEAAVEGVPEFIQAGQEQAAQNIALQREGFDVPTMRGVVGAGVLEGLAGAGLGAGFGGVEAGLRSQARTQAQRILAEEEKQRIALEDQAEQQRIAEERAAEEERMRPIREAEARVPAEEPVGPSITRTGRAALMGGEDPLAEAMRARREAEEAKAEVPLGEDYEFLQREKQRLLAEPQTKENRAQLKRIEDQILGILQSNIEWRPGGPKAVRASVFGEAELPTPITREQLMAPKVEPFKPATTVPRSSLLGAAPAGGGVADVLAARREAEAAKAEVPLSEDYAFLTREKNRLSALPKTPENTAAIGRIDEEIRRLDTQAIERRRRDAEAAKTSVFAQEQLPPVESRGAVVAERDLAEMQAREPFPEPKKSEIRKQIEQAERLAGTPEPITDVEMDLKKEEESLKGLKAKNRGRPLIKAIAGLLDPKEIPNIGIDDKRLKGELMNKAGKGTFLSELVSNGSLDEFLEPSQRLDSPSRDVDKATQTIREKIEDGDYSFYGIGSEIKKAEAKIDYLARSIGEPKRAEYEISEVEPGEAASIERTAGDAEVLELLPDLEGLRYQRTETTGKPIGKDQTQSIVDTVKSQWANAPEVVVAENMDDPVIPAEVRAHNKAAMQKGAKGSPRGFFYKGKVYVLADAATSPTQVIETLFHESLGHYGLRGTFGPEMEAVLRDVVKNRRADVEAKAEQYGLDPKNESDMLEAAEEVLSDIAQTKPGLSFVKRAIAVIRNFLRDLGLPFKMSNEDIIQKYILPARAFVEKGGSKGMEGKPAAAREGVRYQREGEPEETGKSKPTRLNIAGEPILGSWVIQADPQMEINDGLIYKFLDKNVDIKRIVQTIEEKAGEIAAQWNPYLKEELYHGRVAKATEEFRDKEWQPLLDEMKAMDVQVGELEQYLLNRHAEEYNKHIAKVNPTRPEMQDGGSSVTTEDARAYLASLPKDKKAKYEALAKRVDKITKGTRDLLVETGYEKPETIKAWEQAFPNYVPLFREEGDFDYNFGSFGTGRGFDVRRSFSRSAMGSKRQVVDIIANVIGARNNAIILTEKNRVAQAVYGLALESPNPDFWLAINPDAEKQPADVIDELKRMGLDEDALKNLAMEPRQRALDPKKNEVVSRINNKLRENDNVLATRINGERRYVFFNPKDERSKRAATALKNLDAEDLGMALGFISSITRWMAAVNTQYNPIFGPYNFLRDVQAAALQLSTTPLAGQQKEISKYIVPSLKTIYSSLRKRRKGEEVDTELGKLWQEFQKEGGQTGFKDVFSRTQDRQQALVNELTRMSEGKLKGGFREVGNWLSDYNDSLENAVRLSAYKVAKEKFLKEGKSVDEAKQRAASLAKNLTVNFNRKGQVATQMGALYAFFNASMQGTARLYETLKGPMGKKIIAGGLLLGAMQAALLAAAGFDDEEPPDFVRERNIIIPLGGDKYFAFPMPLGFHVIPGISRILTEWTLSGFKDTPERVASLTGMFLEAFNPVGNAGWSLQTGTPTFLDPFIALAENKDWTGKPIYKEDLFALRPTPGYTRAKEATNVFYKSIAEFLNLASGGTKYQKGMFSPTPEQIEYLVGQATGGVGREISKLITTGEKLATGEELPSYKIPLAGRFYGETKSSAAESSRFYKNMERLNKLNAEIKGRRDNREPLGDFMRENPEARLAPMAEKTYKGIQQLRKRREQLVERDAPRESVKAVEEQIKRRMAVFNERVARFSE